MAVSEGLVDVTKYASKTKLLRLAIDIMYLILRICLIGGLEPMFQ